MEHQCILLVRTEKNNEVKYLLYLCQKSVKDRKLSTLACKTLTALVLPPVKNASGKRGKIPLFVFKHYVRKLPLI